MKQNRNYLDKWTALVWTMTCFVLYVTFDAFGVNNIYSAIGTVYVAGLILFVFIHHFIEINTQNITSGYTLFGIKIYQKTYPVDEIDEIDVTSRKYIKLFLGWGYRIRGKKIGFIAPNTDGTLVFSHNCNIIYISITNIKQIQQLLKI